MRIAFVAMSGIRVVDQELLDLGLTLPGFVERSKAIASLPSLGLLTLAGMTPARHECRYIEVDQVGDQNLSAFAEFDLVALSSFTAQIPEAYALAEAILDQGIPVVMGGLHVTALPEEAEARGIVTVCGEGELAWPSVLADAEAGALRRRYDVRNQRFDLSRAPMPAYELLDMERYNRITVQTSRGCPWRCAFCASSVLLTDRYTQKPAHKILAEIDRIIELWPRPFLELADDNSFVHRPYWKQLLPRLARRKIRWFTESDLSIWKDPELLELLAEAGCKEVLIGFESPLRGGVSGIELRADRKAAWLDEQARAVETIQRHGIRVNACFVLGLDGDGTDVFDAVEAFVREATPFDVQITYPTPFPGTPFYAQLERERRLTHPGQWERCTLFDINFEPLRMSRDELREGFLRLTRSLYTDGATAQRRAGFLRHARLGRSRARRRAPIPRTAPRLGA